MATIKREKFLAIQTKKGIESQSDQKSGERTPDGREKMGTSREKICDTYWDTLQLLPDMPPQNVDPCQRHQYGAYFAY